MSRVFFPTFEALDENGGIARYLKAMQSVLGDEIEFRHYAHSTSRFSLLRDILFSKQPFIWTTHILPIGTYAFFAKLFFQKRYTVFLHGMDFDLALRNVWKRFLTKRILAFADHVVVNTNALKREVEKVVLNKEVVVVYPCPQQQFIDYVPVEREVNDSVTLLSVSRLVQRKGHESVLRALVSLPKLVYKIVGDGPYKGELLKMVADLGLKDRVEFLGATTDAELLAIYDSADIFVMPTVKTSTDREGFGIVYLEAQLCSLPVIASLQPGVDEAVQHDVTGILVNGQGELVDAISRLAEDADLRVRMGRAGRAFVLNSFSAQEQFSKLRLFLYEK